LNLGCVIGAIFVGGWPGRDAREVVQKRRRFAGLALVPHPGPHLPAHALVARTVVVRLGGLLVGANRVELQELFRLVAKAFLRLI